ncbi:hypothetical protein T05_1366 [Trichinella murrelli]|uniref:Uncharacterized protein n=1 Tax=Trichinella murrelli TaxID=144512 RepID=A0A0V0U4L2_9BILA|nr:hypothetical protein T05_1366 [Trichinella murrelli]
MSYRNQSRNEIYILVYDLTMTLYFKSFRSPPQIKENTLKTICSAAFDQTLPKLFFTSFQF